MSGIHIEVQHYRSSDFFFAGKPDRFAVILAQKGPKPGVLSVICLLQRL
jgi:hypothetical protein